MTELKGSIESYILAKDGNRPHLLTDAFARDASLAMTVKTAAIAFPQETHGRDAIASVLVSEFALKYENVYTFCVGAVPAAHQSEFSCDWLVCMTEKATGAARVGYGRYEWTSDGQSSRVTRLHITIEDMATLAAEFAESILRWASRLPYPWCARDALKQDAPDIETVQRVVTQLTR
ncbi:hypothetical protein [Paraburkholderia caribensis]|uniref:hypothetical protein n=1 Tax=Paraburkholderia caribensis TaxID=75105 RepID=UPI00078D0CF3|nr:hypothetical protein [Paraburkholderia caribensis]AMV46839.1 hypothetical protein ATN79_33355 [Paraburkholderia caribensis]CAG9226845.1 conserved hypothetical protein [Paraburkholderia caribensis]